MKTIDCWKGDDEDLDELTLKPKFSGLWVYFDYTEHAGPKFCIDVHLPIEPPDPEGPEVFVVRFSPAGKSGSAELSVTIDRETGHVIDVVRGEVLSE